MTYKGRIFGIIMLSINGVYSFFYALSIKGHIGILEITLCLLAPTFGWFLGHQFDKVSDLNKKVQQQNQEFKILFENSNAYIWSSDLCNHVNTVSEGLARIYGYTAEEFKKDYDLWFSRIHPDDIKKASVYYSQLGEGIHAKGEWRIIRKDGEVRWIEAFGSPVHNAAGEVVKLNGVAYDVTERKSMEAQMEHMAYHDYLTKLPNRIHLTNIFDAAIKRCSSQQQEFSFLFIDLDRFKFINDTMGHAVGDQLLIQVSQRLVACVRNEDVVARLGGDEFVILVEDIKRHEVQELADRILTCFANPFVLEGEEFFITPSIGISLYPKDGHDLETLMIKADKAMYLAKNSGKNKYQFYIQENEHELGRKKKLEQGLKRALVNKEFMLYYQPTICLQTEQIIGVEALIRWQHPELGLISPMEFIPIAEDIGMIIPIGKWVLEEACRQNKEWQDAGIQLKTAVNVSALQFQDPYFLSSIEEVLDKNQLAAKYLGLEITESVMQNIKQSFTIIHELKRIGVTVSIDDFGTGYSSLSILNNLPIDVVKIDKSFVNEITSNTKSAALIKTMIEMGKNLDFDLLAEGIETNQQAEFLIENGSSYGQGYYYSRPLPVDEIEKLLKESFVIT